MKIQFVNKNNNAWYDIDPGITITDNYNETLDSAQLVLSHIVNKINIEPFDRVIIDMNGAYKYMCVDTYSCTQTSFSSPIYYQYNISLFSETKLLEGVILPSLKITQLKGDYKRKIYSDDENDILKFGYLDEYLKEYGKKVRKETEGQIKFVDCWYFSDRVKERFSQIVCPEMQWNQPTLRQVLNDLMMIDDCTVVLRNNEIDYIDISKIGSEINASGISQVQESRSSQDYVSELRVELKNVMQSNIDGVNDVITASEFIGFRNSDSYKVSDNNIRIEVRNPIIEIKKLWVRAALKLENHNYYYICFDITPYVFEYKEWLTKEIYYNVGLGNIPPVDSVGQYQQNSLYFKRYDNKIENLTLVGSALGGLLNLNAFQNVLAKPMNEIGMLTANGSVFPMNSEVLEDYCFEIEYKTTASSLMQVSRSDNVNNHRIVVDNQTNSYVDAYAQGLLEYMKVNRLGNTMKVIDARYGYEDNIPELSQTFNGSVIFQRKLSYFDDYIEANFICTEGYVLKDYFTGVQAKIRSWKIVDGNEALERHDLIKYYLEFSYNNVNEVSIGTFENKKLEKYFLNCFTTNRKELMKYGCVLFNDKDFNRYPNEGTFLTDTVSRISGNSLLFTIGFSDNYEAGRYIDKDVSISNLGGLAQQPCRYVDENGENIGGVLYLRNKHNGPEVTGTGEPNSYVDYGSAQSAIFIDIRDQIRLYQNPKPIALDAEFEIWSSYYQELEIPFYFHKDNSEITRITTQFEFCSDTRDIVFGSQFLKNLQAIRTVELNISGYKLYESDKQPSFRNKDFLPNDKAPVDSMQLFLSNNQLTVTYSSASTKDYLYLTDENDNVIIAFKKVGETVTTMYLNLLKDRNKNIYDDNGYIVGNIYI